MKKNDYNKTLQAYMKLLKKTQHNFKPSIDVIKKATNADSNIQKVFSANTQVLIERLGKIQKQMIKNIPELRLIDNQGTVTSIVKFRELVSKYNTRNDCYFRGQSNSEWHLNSSIERFKLPVNELNIEKINTDFINAIYNTTNINSLDFHTTYETLSYFQHYHSYSPLIDFSSDIVHALYFALYNSQEMYKNKQNFSLYIIHFDKNKILTDINEIEEKVHNSKIIFIKNMDHHSFLRQNDFSIINLEQNDRMKFQKGVFLLNEYTTLYSKEFSEEDFNFITKQLSRYQSKRQNTEYKIRRYEISYKLIPKIVYEYLIDDKFSDLLDPTNFVNPGLFLKNK